MLSNTSGFVCSGVVINVQGSGGKWVVLEMKDNDVSQHRITIYFFNSCSSLEHAYPAYTYVKNNPIMYHDQHRRRKGMSQLRCRGELTGFSKINE